jgi:hypothetical protein
VDPVGVENVGWRVATGCVGRLIGVTSGSTPRRDIDPVQLRWAGVPRSRSFIPVDLGRGQREYLNVCMHADEGWQILTFEDPDFDPGFTTKLPDGERHVLYVAVFSGNAETTTRSLVIDADADDGATGVQLNG